MDSDELVAGAQLLLRSFGRIGSFGYLPMAPLVTAEDQWPALWPALHRRAGRRRAFMLKVGAGSRAGIPTPRPGKLALPGQQPSHPPRSILIDLRADEEQILARMNQGTAAQDPQQH